MPADGAPDGEGDWPDESDESSILSELASRGEAPVPAALRGKPAPSEKLPPVDELVARIPAGVLGLLDDLFRAKFTAVRRYEAPAEVKPSSPAPSAGAR
jgi:hypothetical protein